MILELITKLAGFFAQHKAKSAGKPRTQLEQSDVEDPNGCGQIEQSTLDEAVYYEYLVPRKLACTRIAKQCKVRCKAIRFALELL
jgi:hypothetical protein